MDHTTSQRDIDAKRLDRYIEREQLVSMMSTTKWRKALAAIDALSDYHPRFRVKCLREAESPTWDTSFPYHVPHPYKVIEWIEFDPIVRYRRGQLLADKLVDCSESIMTALQKIQVLYETTETGLRIWGYVRPTARPTK